LGPWDKLRRCLRAKGIGGIYINEESPKGNLKPLLIIGSRSEHIALMAMVLAGK
jgi:hypothetical protein